MPNLINVLREQGKNATHEEAKTDVSQSQPQTEEEERRKVLEGAGMEWGTCMVFSCEQDCCAEGGEEGWREEVVLVQWDE